MTADCRFLGLTEIPKDLPVDVTELDVGYNDITTLYNDSFTGFPALTTLQASFNYMVHIEVAAFYTMPDLQELVLNHNALQDLADNLFLYMSIAQFMLKGNKIKVLQDQVFMYLNNTLLLSGNVLDDMHSETFSNMTALTKLALDDCDITYLHPDIFSNLTSLQYLFLHDNKIKKLDPHHFINLISVIEIL
ncbi:tsukushi-A-like [Diadema setosum]|uniref:tsukushi-A-like n=1 Tax=Diadema setosum TaxID=31175 RepID=UPI003B3A3334